MVYSYEGFTHTHPDDKQSGNWNWQFSDFQSNGILNGGGDQGAAILAGRSYMVDQTGKLYEITRETAASALLAGEGINTKDASGNYKYRMDYGTTGGEIY